MINIKINWLKKRNNYKVYKSNNSHVLLEK